MIYTILEGDNTISFDCITSASISQEATVTEFPTENGSPISDHVYLANIKFAISGVISDFSFYNPLSASAGSNVFFGKNGEILGGEDLPESNILQSLRYIFTNKRLVTLVVSKKVAGESVETYENCVIKSINVEDKPDNGESTIFNIALEQIRYATTRTSRETKIPELLKTQAQIAAAEAAAVAEKTEEQIPETTPLTQAEADRKARIAATLAEVDKNLVDIREINRRTESIAALGAAE